MALVAIVLTIVLANTSWGRYVYAIGGNEQAALLTGIPVVPVTETEPAGVDYQHWMLKDVQAVAQALGAP